MRVFGLFHADEYDLLDGAILVVEHELNPAIGVVAVPVAVLRAGEGYTADWA